MDRAKPFGKPGETAKAGAAPAASPATPPRRYGTPGGAQSLAALLPPLLKPAFRRRSPAASRVLSEWERLVGPGLAARTAPKRLAAGTLTLGCSGATALELRHVEASLLERINVQLGERCVTKLRFVNEIVGAPAPDAGARRRAEIAPPPPVEGVAGPLGETLARLGAAIAARDAEPS